MVRDAFGEDVGFEYRKLKLLADRALAQVEEGAWFVALDDEGNSLALLVKHVAGNLRSRWTDFRTSDGERPDRDRDREFVLAGGDTREELILRWEEGWRLLFAAIGPLTRADFEATVRIRGEAHTVRQALLRQLSHYAYHVGQIVFLARHHAGPRWQSQSIPRGASRTHEPD